MELYQEAKEEDASAVLMLSTTYLIELTNMLTGLFKDILKKRSENRVVFS
jgi:hypothetical protein